MKQKKKAKIVEDILLQQKEDRRMLSNVPDKTEVRTNADRRGQNFIDHNIEDINQFMAN